MRTVEVEIEGSSRLGYGRNHNMPHREKEADDDYENRTWRDKIHATKDGFAFIPAAAFKFCLQNAALYLGIKIPGKGSAKYTKHFKSGIAVYDDLVLEVKKKDAQHLRLFVPSDGRSGGSKRVWKNFPFYEPEQWGGVFIVYILDNEIPMDVFERVAHEAGKFIGLLTSRPQNGGNWGRFKIKRIEVIEDTEKDQIEETA